MDTTLRLLSRTHPLVTSTKSNHGKNMEKQDNLRHLQPKNPTTKPTNTPPTNDFGITKEGPSNTTQQINIQEILSQIDNRDPSHYIDCHVNPDLDLSGPSSAQVSTTNG